MPTKRCGFRHDDPQPAVLAVVIRFTHVPLCIECARQFKQDHPYHDPWAVDVWTKRMLSNEEASGLL